MSNNEPLRSADAQSAAARPGKRASRGRVPASLKPAIKTHDLRRSLLIGSRCADFLVPVLLMKQLRTLLVPVLVTTAVVSVSDQTAAPEAEAQPGAASSERTAENKPELRATQSVAGEKRPAVRIILPSPYGSAR